MTGNPVEPVDVHRITPRAPNGTGVVVLSGSSGRVETDRAQVLSALGAHALTYRWFGGPGQPAGICEYPLEAFGRGIDLLEADCDRIVLLGTSKSAEAFLTYAAHDPRVDAVIAFAPSHVSWANVGPGPDGQDRPQRSSWTLGGAPVPFVRYEDDFPVTGEPPRFTPMYAASLALDATVTTAAVIPVERIFGEVLVVAGGDDGVWPSARAAEAIEARRAAYDLPTVVVSHPDAGHRVILPGETPVAGGQAMDRGGSEGADRELGRLAWPHVRRILGG